jgi:hypothetical protein
MTAREIASLWIIGVAAIFIIIWDHRNQAGSVLNALGASQAPSAGAQSMNAPIIPQGAPNNTNTNNAEPVAGNEFGFIATYGNRFSGDTSASGVDAVFGNIFDNIANG